MATTVEFEVVVKDVEYQRQGDVPWLARVYRPVGTGPFPTVVDVHGGAWNNGDRLNDTLMNKAMAAQGVLTVAIDFRQPPEAGYPASVQDMNLAIRWLKVHASEYGGLMASSTNSGFMLSTALHTLMALGASNSL